VASYALNVLLLALKAARGGGPLDLEAAVARLLHPVRPVDWVDLVGPPVAGVAMGFAVAAYLAARRGLAFATAGTPSSPPR
jgi:PAT family beta-lactamase induction signal transducer AmpG